MAHNRLISHFSSCKKLLNISSWAPVRFLNDYETYWRTHFRKKNLFIRNCTVQEILGVFYWTNMVFCCDAFNQLSWHKELSRFRETGIFLVYISTYVPNLHLFEIDFKISMTRCQYLLCERVSFRRLMDNRNIIHPRNPLKTLKRPLFKLFCT